MKPTRFVLVDDDKLDNKLSSLYIRQVLPEIEIVDFTIPEEGLNYVETAFCNGPAVPTILFLDINMVTMTAWEFLAKFNAMEQKIKDQITVYILSSSVDLRDMNDAEANECVKGYFVKPITKSLIEKLYQEHI